MTEVLQEAEKILNIYADKDIYERYIKEKTRIFYGPFADIISMLHKENLDLSNEISRIKPELRLNLEQYVIRNIDLLTKQYDSFIAEPETIEEASSQLLHALTKVEHLLKEEMGHLRLDNYQKVHQIQKTEKEKNKPIDALKPCSPKTKFPKKREHLAQLNEEISIVQQELNLYNLKNQGITASDAENIGEKNEIRSRYEAVMKTYNRVKEKYDDITFQRDKLESDIANIQSQIDKLKINQRYAGRNVGCSDPKKLDELNQIRGEIENLQSISNQYQIRKRKATIRNIQMRQKMKFMSAYNDGKLYV